MDKNAAYCIHTAPDILLASEMGQGLMPSFSLEDTKMRKFSFCLLYPNSVSSLFSRSMAQYTHSLENQSFLMVVFHSEECCFTVETLFVR